MHRIKRRKGSNGDEGDTPPIDRLSDLPDSILCHILSFLPTRTSIRTSVLATRWRFVWKFVPNLHFKRENHDFINRVLLLHKLPTINTLRLCLEDFDNNCSDYLMESWIIAIDARNVRNLRISNFHGNKLPLHLFTCETLVDLTLYNSCSIIPMANTVWLPRLKKLNLSFVQFEADESLPRLLSGCPVLEYLILTLLIEGDSLVFCNISSPTLKRLELDLDYSYADPVASNDHDYRLKIDTPALGYLKINDGVSERIESEMMTSLSEATIWLHNHAENVDDFVYSQSVLKFVNRLHNVKCLELDLQLSSKIIDSVAIVSFRNLKELKLISDGLFLSKFLQNADNLETLVFSEVCDEGERDWVEPEQVPTCLSSHLRTVKMSYSGTLSDDFEIVRYLLRNARILEHIEISYHQYFKGKKWSLEEVAQIERGSEACELTILDLVDVTNL